MRFMKISFLLYMEMHGDLSWHFIA
jgi:hypothetical protein